MIDRAKNICYLITVPYEVRGEMKYQKFLSLHGISTKHFEAFRDEYFREVLQVSPKCIGEWEKDGMTVGAQSTISWKDWKKHENIRNYVLEGITEREKCW